MNCRARTTLLLVVLTAFTGKTAPAQVVMHPTPNPTVTAEYEAWYLEGQPITHAGSLYYPAGPRVHFTANEMVRSGFYMGIPLYSRTTIEPFSVVYVPVGPGLLQPYERPRTGPLAETSGSLASSLPPMPGSDPGTTGLQAAGPPSLTTTDVPIQVPAPVGTAGTASVGPEAAAPSPAGASRVTSPRRAARSPRSARPKGANAIFIEFEGDRWYMAGPAQRLDVAALESAGSYKGVPVWRQPTSHDGIIYVPVIREGGSLAVPYSRAR